MRISHVAVENLRRFESLRFEPHPRLTVFRGANAAGKTSLLEAVYLATRAGSFRVRRLDELVREGQPHSKVQIAVRSDVSPGDPPVQWSVRVQRSELQIRRFDEVLTRRDLAEAVPVTLVDRQLHRVFEEGPIYRRRYLDWGMFYVEPSFLNLWRRYERALRQRNLALRQRQPVAVIQAWDPELVQSGIALHGLRQAHLAALESEARVFLLRLLETERFSLQLQAGWDESLGLEACLQQGLAGDRKMAYTHAGPHRAELRLRFEEHEARSFVSRGQQKMLAVAMVLAQASLVARTRGEYPVLLLDDLEAELSQDWQRRLLAALLNYPGQSLVSSLEWHVGLLPPSNRTEYRLFHVEQGALSTVGST